MSSKSESISEQFNAKIVVTPPSGIKEETCNNNDVNESKKSKIEHQTKPLKTDKSSKLPAEILKRFHCEPRKLLIAGNVDWDKTGKKGERNELNVFHRFTDEKVTKNYLMLKNDI